MKRCILFFALIITLSSCGTTRHPSYSNDAKQWKSLIPDTTKPIIHSLYLIGDAGDLDNTDNQSNYVLESLKKHLTRETTETSLVFLGDNIYPHGLPAKKSYDRSHSEEIINAQLDCANYHKGPTYFIPGNHDWNKHNPGGKEAILRQELYIESYSDNTDQINFYPDNACGDPKVIRVHKNLVYVFIDTQWWLQDWNKEKNINQGCKIKSRDGLLKKMELLIAEYRNDELVILMHHPIKSDGVHGGRFGLRHHLFPLTEIQSDLWIPLPIIGSLYPMFRKFKGSKQDIPNKLNSGLMQELDKIAKRHNGNVIFATGHDHGLQFFEGGNIKYIISGAGGKLDYVKKNGKANYARSGRGFVKIDFYKNMEAWAMYYVIDSETGTSNLEYRIQLRESEEPIVN